MDYVLARGIIHTIVYYDVMDYPMSAMEIWRHLMVNNSQCVWSLGDVYRALDHEKMQEFVGNYQGFYFLLGRSELVEERKKRETLSIKKIKKLKTYVRLLRFVPFVESIVMTGRLAMKHAENGSDLDVLMIIKSNRLWVGRFLVTAFLQVLGIRRHGSKHTDRICLNYYISDRDLTVPTQDIFAAHEYSFMVVLSGEEVFSEFLLANRWIREYRPNFISDYVENQWSYDDSQIVKFAQKILGVVFDFDFLERALRRYQYQKIMRNPLTSLPGSLIIANDSHLVFLPHPHGPKIYEEYQRRLSALELPWPQ